MTEAMGYGEAAKVDRFGERLLGVLALVAVAVVGVLGAGDGYLIRLLTLGCIYGALALGLRLTFGELGELDLGYLALFTIGAYSYALVRIHWDLSELPAALVAIAIAMGVSMLVSLLTLRLTGPFFAVTTLGILVVTTTLIASNTDFTGGINGLGRFGGGLGSKVPYSSFTSTRAWFLFAFSILCFVTALTYWLQSSRFGDAINSIRQDPVLFRSLGYNVTLFRSFAAALGGAIAGLAGSTFAVYTGFISVDLLSLTLLGVLLLMLKLGGARSPAGVIVGSFVVILLPEYLRFVGKHRLMVFGALLVVTVRVFQSGFGPQLGMLLARLRGRQPSAPSMTVPPDPTASLPDSPVTEGVR